MNLGCPARRTGPDSLGRAYDSRAEENLEVLVAPGRKWCQGHEDLCRHHRTIEPRADADRVRYTCFCGVEFAPVQPATAAERS